MHKKIVTCCIVITVVFGVLFYGCQANQIEKIEEKEETLADSAGETNREVGEAGAEGVGALQPCVFVCGQVKEAGVYRLVAGSRIIDAISAAGGFTEQAAKEYWNLAEPVTDGQKIYVPDLTEAVSRPADTQAGNSSGTVAPDGKLDINLATRAELLALPGIGEKRADDILAYRDKNGPFSRMEDIQKVSGIKGSVYEKIRGLITVR